jgi:hypothetical protein
MLAVMGWLLGQIAGTILRLFVFVAIVVGAIWGLSFLA